MDRTGPSCSCVSSTCWFVFSTSGLLPTGHMPPCPSELPSFLLRLLLSCGIPFRWSAGEVAARCKLGEVFRQCLFACLDMYNVGPFVVGLPQQDPKRDQVDARNLCPSAFSTPPLPRAGSRKVDLWGLAFTPLDDSLTLEGAKTSG